MSATPVVRALVVYESMFGNTEKVAAAVARGLQAEGVETGLVEAQHATTLLPTDLDLLVVGGPTHGFSMSRTSTRADAVRQGAPEQRTRLGIREWLETVQCDPAHAPRVATFDTRVTKVRWLPQAAAASAARAARKRGLEVVGKPHGFLVEDLRGPLVGHELEHAVAWGEQLAQQSLQAALAGPARGTV